MYILPVWECIANIEQSMTADIKYIYLAKKYKPGYLIVILKKITYCFLSVLQKTLICFLNDFKPQSILVKFTPAIFIMVNYATQE